MQSNVMSNRMIHTLELFTSAMTPINVIKIEAIRKQKKETVNGAGYMFIMCAEKLIHFKFLN